MVFTQAEFPREAITTLAATGPLRIARLEPNVLTLDYVDITAGGETHRARSVILAMGAGRKAARSMKAYLGIRELGSPSATAGFSWAPLQPRRSPVHS